MQDFKYAVLFDKDGVLVDTELGKKYAMESALAELGHKNLEGFNEWYFGRVGVPGDESAERCVDVFGLKNVEPNELYERTEQIRVERRNQPVPIIKNSITFLRDVNEARYGVAVVSSDFRDNSRRHMDQAGVLDLIDVIVSGEKSQGDVSPGRDKPHPDIYQVAAKKLDINPRYCIGIEDTAPGVQAVKAAGMYCIGYSNPNSGNQDLKAAGADKVVSDLSNIDVFSLFSKYISKD